jgi:hypothetical protein
VGILLSIFLPDPVVDLLLRVAYVLALPVHAGKLGVGEWFLSACVPV